jgi:selenide,water dikinase
MLQMPGHIAGLYTKDECHIDLGKLCGWAGVRLIKAEACGLDVSARRVKVAGNRPDVPYDVLSINIGSSPSLAGMTAQSAHANNVTPVKPIDGFSRRWDAILERVYELSGKCGMHVAIPHLGIRDA